MRFSVLGPLEVTDNGHQIALGGSKQRGVLAMLLLNANEVVSVDRLVDGLWGESPPATAQKMVQLYVSRLRKELGPKVIRTSAPGYAAGIEPDALDLLRFRELAGSARRAASTDPEAAAVHLREALGLWRGEPLSDLAFEPFALGTLPGLAELRETAREECVDLELALGRHAELVPELEAAVAAHPLRERLRGQLMLAQYRSGRQAEALETYRAGREALVDTLGIEPGPELQRLHAAILRQDPELELPARPQVIPLAEDVPGLPGGTSDFPRLKTATTSVRRRRRRAYAALAVFGVLVATTTTALVLVRGNARTVDVLPDSVAVLDASTGRVLDDVPVGEGPGPIAAGGTGVWVANRDARTVLKLDPESGEIVQTYGLAATPQSLAVGGGTVWVANGYSGTISRIITRYSFISRPIRLRPSVQGLVALAATPRQLWLGFQDGSVGRFDPESLDERGTVTGFGSPSQIALGAGSAWVAQTVAPDVARIRMKHVELEQSVTVGGSPVIAFGHSAVWVATSNGRLSRIDPKTTTIVASVPVGSSPAAIAADAKSVWVASRGGELFQVDPTTNTLVRSLRLGHSVAGLVLRGGKLWATVGP